MTLQEKIDKCDKFNFKCPGCKIIIDSWDNIHVCQTDARISYIVSDGIIDWESPEVLDGDEDSVFCISCGEELDRYFEIVNGSVFFTGDVELADLFPFECNKCKSEINGYNELVVIQSIQAEEVVPLSIEGEPEFDKAERYSKSNTVTTQTEIVCAKCKEFTFINLGIDYSNRRIEVLK